MVHEQLWLSAYPEEIPTSIQYDEKPLHEFLKEAAFSYKEKKALHFMGKELSFQDVYEQSKQFANYLQQLGIVKGDRIAIMLPNSPQGVIGYYGSLLAGAVVVQTNPLYKERELVYQLADSGAKVIICLDILYPMVSKVKKKIPN